MKNYSLILSRTSTPGTLQAEGGPAQPGTPTLCFAMALCTEKHAFETLCELKIEAGAISRIEGMVTGYFVLN
jgi:hypothetical protein